MERVKRAQVVIIRDVFILFRNLAGSPLEIMSLVTKLIEGKDDAVEKG